jgi:hypothetical protein
LKKERLSSFLAMLVALLISPAAISAGEETMLVRSRLPRGTGFGELVERGIDVLAINRDGTYDMVVTGGQLDWLRSGSPRVDIIGRPMLGAASDLDENLGLYHTYDEMLDALGQMVLDYPTLTRLDTIGTTHEGRVIVALKISDNAAVDESETEVLIVGCHHARELMSVDVPLMFAQHLLSNYGVSTFVTSMVDGREIWIAPMINPDGHVYVQNNHASDWWNWWRKNRRINGDGSIGVDLNRNYGYQWGYDGVGSSPDPSSLLYRGPYAFSEPETEAVRDLCNSREFSVALSYHSYGELIIHPWGYAPLITDDHEMFTVLGDSLSRGNDYYVGCTATNILYPTNGDSDDWMYGETVTKNRMFSYTIELNTLEEGGFGPPDSLIVPTFNKVLPLNFTVLSRADDPYSVLGPFAPEIYPIVDLADPYHLIYWSGSGAGDPNPAGSWEVLEYEGYTSVTDSGYTSGTAWLLDGFTLSTARYTSSPRSYYSGSGNNIDHTMSMVEPYSLDVLGQTIRCDLWYDIEEDWDYAYLEESYDDGLTWSTCIGDVTTTADPNGKNRGNGITGYSGGWIPAQFYVGLQGEPPPGTAVRLRFVYSTDSSINGEGIYIDNISPVSSCSGKSLIASDHPDTFLVRESPGIGGYAYMVRAIDTEGHRSPWSSLAHHIVSDITGREEIPPVHSGLESVYPNPFNPRTTIRFTVGKGDISSTGRAAVQLEVFDVAGRSVRVLEDGYREAGSHTVSWDGTSSGGEIAASGFYFVRLTVGSRSFSRKMVLLK